MTGGPEAVGTAYGNTAKGRSINKKVGYTPKGSMQADPNQGF